MQSSTKNQILSTGLASRLLILAVIVLFVGVVVLTIGVLVFETSIHTGILALVVCLFSALLAHIASEYPRGDVYITARMALQMAVRTVPPFAVAVWGLNLVQPPLETSLVFYMILFYLIGLITEVQLSLTRLNQTRVVRKY